MSPRGLAPPRGTGKEGHAVRLMTSTTPAGPAPSPLRIGVLGPMQITRLTGALEEPVPAGSPQQQAVLAMLALRAGKPVTVNEIVDGVLGDDPPKSATSMVSTYVARLRLLLDPNGQPQTRSTGGRTAGGVLASVPGGYMLRVPGEAVDALRFDDLVAEAREHAAAEAGDDLVRARARLAAALDLWRGEPLTALPGPYAAKQRHALAERRAAALETALQLDLDLGLHHQAVMPLTEAAALYPYRERLHAALMLALHRCGRTAEALEAYARIRGELVGELGVEPGPHLRDMHARILAADPDLLPPRPAPAPVAPVSPAPAAVPRIAVAQLPASPADFTGRDDHLAQLTAALSPRAQDEDLDGCPGTMPVAVITGLGGVGKTTLAVRAAHLLVPHYRGGQLYIDLRGVRDHTADPGDPAGSAGPLLPGDVLGTFLRTLGTEAVPDTETERAALYRTVLHQRTREAGGMLIVLDNAADAAQVQPLLPGDPRCAVLITGRTYMTGLPASTAIRLTGLTPGDSVTLVQRIIGRDRVATEPGAAADLVDACAYLPLALRIVASRLAARRTWTLAHLAQRLAAAGHRRLPELRAGNLAVEAAFEVGYTQLTPEPATVFRLLAVPDAADLTVAAAAAVLDMDEAEAERALEQLVDVALLESPSAGRYRFHDLVREFARDKAARTLPAADRHGALLRLIDFAVATARNATLTAFPSSQLWASLIFTRHPGRRIPDTPAACGWVTRELTHLLATAEQGIRSGDDYTVIMGGTLLAYLADFIGKTIGWRRLEGPARTFVECAEAGTFTHAEAVAHFILGRVYLEGSRFDQARPHLERARLLVTDHEAGPVPAGAPADAGERVTTLGRRLLLAHILERLAEIDFYRGDHAGAVRLIDRAMALSAELGDWRGLNWQRSVLAQVAVRDGRPDQAIELCAQVLADCRAQGDTEGEMEITYALAAALRATGRYVESAACYTEIIRLARREGLGRSESVPLYWLAETLTDAGDLDAAVDAATEAHTIAGSCDDTLALARSHAALGRALYERGDPRQAEHHLRTACRLYTELGMGPEADQMTGMLRRIAAGDPAMTVVSAYGSPAPIARDGGHADRGEHDLDGQLAPVDALGVGDAEAARDGRADEGGHDPDDHGEPDRYRLAARHDETAQRADHEADDQGGDDSGDVHRTSFLSEDASDQLPRTAPNMHEPGAGSP